MRLDIAHGVERQTIGAKELNDVGTRNRPT